MSPYEALKAYGHSPAKAAEIVLDANRGDWFSQRWINFATAQVGRNAKRQDPQGLGPKDKHAVPPEEAGCAQPLSGVPHD
jgi:hypothetical protein